MNKIKKLSIIVPVYNEEKTIGKIIEKLFSVKFVKIKLEVIVVNDGSKDNSFDVLKKISKLYPIKIISYKNNKGKSCAIREGLKNISGEVVTIQDGDLEYNPNDFLKMLEKIEEENVKVVYGSRRLNKTNVQYSGISFYLGGLFLTYLVNFLYKGNITDEPTCYKMFESNLLKDLNLQSKRFEFCPEVTTKILRQSIKIHEVPISYHPRNAKQGKKIHLGDFFEALYTILKYRFVK